jgi:hypothetical protein
MDLLGASKRPGRCRTSGRVGWGRTTASSEIEIRWRRTRRWRCGIRRTPGVSEACRGEWLVGRGECSDRRVRLYGRRRAGIGEAGSGSTPFYRTVRELGHPAAPPRRMGRRSGTGRRRAEPARLQGRRACRRNLPAAARSNTRAPDTCGTCSNGRARQRRRRRSCPGKARSSMPRYPPTIPRRTRAPPPAATGMRSCSLATSPAGGASGSVPQL